MTVAPKLLYTIGYSGHSVESFVRVLQANAVSVLLDIRMNPVSRKRGFSKGALSDTLREAGVNYLHIRSLGSPAPLRRNLERDRDLVTFFAAFREYLACQQSSIDEASQLALSTQICLMCVEQHADKCHRSVVAELIVEAAGHQIAVSHIPSLHAG